MVTPERFITDAILELRYATQEQVEQAVTQSRTAGKPPEEILLDQGVIDSEQLARATAERYGLDTWTSPPSRSTWRRRT